MAVPGAFLLTRVGGMLQVGAGSVLVALGFSQVVGDALVTFQQVFGGALCTIGGMQLALGLLLVLRAVGARPRPAPGSDAAE